MGLMYLNVQLEFESVKPLFYPSNTHPVSKSNWILNSSPFPFSSFLSYHICQPKSSHIEVVVFCLVALTLFCNLKWTVWLRLVIATKFSGCVVVSTVSCIVSNVRKLSCSWSHFYSLHYRISCIELLAAFCHMSKKKKRWKKEMLRFLFEWLELQEHSILASMENEDIFCFVHSVVSCYHPFC